MSIAQDANHFINHINAVGPVTIPSARFWIKDQLATDPEVLIEWVSDHADVYFITSELETYLTTESQDPS